MGGEYNDVDVAETVDSMSQCCVSIYRGIEGHRVVSSSAIEEDRVTKGLETMLVCSDSNRTAERLWLMEGCVVNEMKRIPNR